MPWTNEAIEENWSDAVGRLIEVAGRPRLETESPSRGPFVEAWPGYEVDALKSMTFALSDLGAAQREYLRLARLAQQRAHDEGAVARASAAENLAAFLVHEPTDFDVPFLNVDGSLTDRARSFAIRLFALIEDIDRTPGGKRDRNPERWRSVVALFLSDKSWLQRTDTEIAVRLGWSRTTLRSVLQKMEGVDDEAAQLLAAERRRIQAQLRAGKEGYRAARSS